MISEMFSPSMLMLIFTIVSGPFSCFGSGWFHGEGFL